MDVSKVIQIKETSNYDTAVIIINTQFFLLSLLNKYIDDIDKTDEYMKSHNSISYSSEEEKQNSEKYNKILGYIYYNLDKCIQYSKKNYNTNKLSVLINLKNTKFTQIDFMFIKHLISKMYIDYEPNLNSMIFANYSGTIKTIYGIIKPFLDKETVKKIKLENKLDIETI
jgi:hypothetical protein